MISNIIRGNFMTKSAAISALDIHKPFGAVSQDGTVFLREIMEWWFKWLRLINIQKDFVGVGQDIDSSWIRVDLIGRAVDLP